ncbi:MAG: glycosyltransferase [Ruminococcus sp.]|nr:glycosyltransferase [Ruminococcus sp.]
MLFSVLIPLYNAEKYIGACIDSVLNQTCDDYEIVIVDDGSTDNSAVIVDEYQKKYSDFIKVLHKDNIGVLLTRRRLLQEAKGEYVVWIDSDDLIKPELLSDLRDEINKNNPDIIVFNYEELSSPEQKSRSLDAEDKCIFEGKNKRIIYTKLLLGQGMNELVTKCVRRELIDIDEDYSQYKHVKMGDDLFCLIPIFDAAKRIEYLDRSYYKYRVVSTSITHTQDYLRYYSYRTIFEREILYVDRWGFSSEEISRLKDKFANNAIDNLVLCAKTPDVSKDEFLAFAKDIARIERETPIYSDSERTLFSKPYQYFYKLFIKKSYSKLYRSIKMIVRISRIKNLVRR